MSIKHQSVGASSSSTVTDPTAGAYRTHGTRSGPTTVVVAAHMLVGPLDANITRGFQGPTSEKVQSEVHYAMLELSSESMGQLLPEIKVTSRADSKTNGRDIHC